MKSPMHRVAADHLGESIAMSRWDDLQARAARIDGEISASKTGYRLTVGERVGEVLTWRYLELMLQAAETAAWLATQKRERDQSHDHHSN